jgi:hypothetical protein
MAPGRYLGSNLKDNDDDRYQLRNKSATQGHAEEVSIHRGVRRDSFSCASDRRLFSGWGGAISAVLPPGHVFLVGHEHGMPCPADDPHGFRWRLVMWLCFIPLLILTPKLYLWAQPEHAADKIVLLKHLYLNRPFLVIRWLIYGVVWCGLSTILTRLSVREDTEKAWQVSSAMEKWSGPGIVLYFITVTFASIDFLMSLDVTWASTIYGFLICAGQGLSAMSLVVAVLVFCAKYEPMKQALTPKHLHDLGKLMLSLVMMWAYLSFSQYLIIYSGNLPQEITWYVRRLNGGWEWVGLIILLLHFALPFSLLLSQQLKRNPVTISKIAIFIVFVRVIDVFWLVEPNFQDVNHPVFTMSWMDVVAPIGFGGLWLAMFFNFLPKRPLLPLGYPDLKKALNHGRH